MTKTLAAAIAVAVLSVTQASAATNDSTVAPGAGAMPCAAFTGAMNQKIAPGFVEDTSFFWAQGLMSGINLAIMLRYGTAQATDYALWNSAQQERHIRLYCEAHPQDAYTRAVVDLIDAMRRGQSLADWRVLLAPPSQR